MAPDDLLEAFVLPEHEDLVSRFAFVGNDFLREELSLVLEYVIFLIQLTEKMTEKPTILYSIHKDIVLWTACIVEAALHYTLCVLAEKGSKEEQKKLLDLSPVYKEMKKCWTLPLSKDGYEQNLACGIQRMVPQSLKGMLLQPLIDKAHAIGLFDASMKKKASYLRTRRNELHLQSLDTRTIYDKNTINTVFSDTRIILNCLQERLSGMI
jgi:hypothetical protein